MAVGVNKLVNETERDRGIDRERQRGTERQRDREREDCFSSGKVILGSGWRCLAFLAPVFARLSANSFPSPGGWGLQFGFQVVFPCIIW